MKTCLTAAWIAPMTAPPLRDAGVVFQDQRIIAVGSIQSLGKSHPDAELHDAGNAIVLPGLVNAHTHLELSSIQRGSPPASFVDWIFELMGKTGQADPGRSVQAGIDQCLRFGVTTIGDITAQPAVSRDVLTSSNLTGISFGEVRAMAQRRGFLEPRLEAAIGSPESRAVSARNARETQSAHQTGATRPGSAKLQPGVSPHAPYSIEIDGYRRCLDTAKQFQLPIATHLAETPDETAFLSDHIGPFKQLWDGLNAWDQSFPRFVGGPIRFAKAVGLLDYPTLLAHVNYCDDAEMDLLAKGQASVVYCPRTHQFFGHPPHRWRQMLARGINLALGTDSCASSPDLNLVDEIRLLHTLAPEVEPAQLWQLITTRAAAALGMPQVGGLFPQALANAVVFPVAETDPLREIIEQPSLPVEVWAFGRQVTTL